MKTLTYDYVIIGSGIIGLSIAWAIKEKYPKKTILIIEKEKEEGMHASGRNSGVLHAGFYYTPDSLKAKFTQQGNEFWRKFCEKYDLQINKCGKVVVTQNEKEIETLLELYERGKKNKVNLQLVDEKELREIEPNAKTIRKALYSPNTASVNPLEIVKKLKELLIKKQVKFLFSVSFVKREKDGIRLSNGEVVEGKIINCAGLFADKIAKEFGFGKDYTILPFKGYYLYYSGLDKPVFTNIYPVPNIQFPFLGVHFTITADQKMKVGPTATPAFWREQYKGFSNFRFNEFFPILGRDLQMFFISKQFRNLAIDELKKINKNYLINQASKMVKVIDKSQFRNWREPGIRAQLLNIKTKQLEMDFIVEGDDKSIHVLNSVSPAFTASIPFANWIVENYVS